MTHAAKDPIGAAIGATEPAAAAPTVTMANYEVTIASTGRPAVLVLPADATDGELAEVCGLILTQILGASRQRRAGPAARIIVPAGARVAHR